MYNQIFGSKTVAEKILTVVSMLMSMCLFIAVPCGVAWLISLFGVSINYLIPTGIGLFFYAFLLVIAMLKLKAFKRITQNMDEEFGKF
ncbi:hypothetical protein [Halalkalibacter alkalisediminis]|uniref:Uncharacterized protein n=1 Tax=Halalkalibacter alkalisediminis TaxID=935616 RepID=A0ABV6NHP8_9BACI|nr:hypothetical protein [Halalkalibacter alkalisediminis]